MTDEAQESPRVEALRKAATIVTGEREDTYGGPEDNFTRIAALWTTLFGREFTASDVALAMAAVKMARLVVSPNHLDSYIDIAGYAACGYEIATKNN